MSRPRNSLEQLSTRSKSYGMPQLIPSMQTACDPQSLPSHDIGGPAHGWVAPAQCTVLTGPELDSHQAAVLSFLPKTGGPTDVATAIEGRSMISRRGEQQIHQLRQSGDCQKRERERQTHTSSKWRSIRLSCSGLRRTEREGMISVSPKRADGCICTQAAPSSSHLLYNVCNITPQIQQVQSWYMSRMHLFTPLTSLSEQCKIQQILQKLHHIA